MNKVKKINKKKMIFFIIIFFILIYIFFLDSSSFYKKSVVKKKFLTMKSKIEEINHINKELLIENEKLENDPKIWEKKAREFGMQKKGDEIFLFKDENKDDNE